VSERASMRRNFNLKHATTWVKNWLGLLCSGAGFGYILIIELSKIQNKAVKIVAQKSHGLGFPNCRANKL
jgi:hypothetical protein